MGFFNRLRSESSISPLLFNSWSYGTVQELYFKGHHLAQLGMIQVIEFNYCKSSFNSLNQETRKASTQNFKRQLSPVKGYISTSRPLHFTSFTLYMFKFQPFQIPACTGFVQIPACRQPCHSPHHSTSHIYNHHFFAIQSQQNIIEH